MTTYGKGRRPQALEYWIKGLEGWDYTITSEITHEYNCIAHAADDDCRWWWPSETHDTYWPENAPREVTRDAFIKAYASIGYEPCDGDDFDPAFEKVAIYFERGSPTHAAKQVDASYWSIKLGGFHDIRHELRALEEQYGKAETFLCRPRKR